MSNSAHSESLTAARTKPQWLRDYPANSPQAKARLIALALLADGRLDSQELDDLSRRRAFHRLGLTREDFFQVLYDFCADLSTAPAREDNYLITPEILTELFIEVSDPAERKSLLRLIFDVIRSDGRLAIGEAQLFWNAVDAWRLAPASTPARLRGKKLRHRRATTDFAIA